MMIEVAQRLFWMDHLETAHLPDSVWLGATIVNQEEADRDIPKLLEITARKRFLSMEPLLGSVDISDWLSYWCEDCEDTHTYGIAGFAGLDWVIVGGGSGPYERPMHPDWPRDLRDQCKDAGVPFFFKQWGEWSPDPSEYLAPLTPNPDLHCWGGHGIESYSNKIGKKRAGRLLDGREWNEVPL
jgi:protein gp37